MALLANAPFDVIVSDISMPEMDGLEFLRASSMAERPSTAASIGLGAPSSSFRTQAHKPLRAFERWRYLAPRLPG